MIKAIEFIKTGFSSEDASKLSDVIRPLFESNHEVIVDFSGITIFTTLFFNNAFTKYILIIGPELYNKRFRLENLSELGEITYQHSLQNAVKYFNMSEDMKKIHNDIIETPEE